MIYHAHLKQDIVNTKSANNAEYPLVGIGPQLASMTSTKESRLLHLIYTE